MIGDNCTDAAVEARATDELAQDIEIARDFLALIVVASVTWIVCEIPMPLLNHGGNVERHRQPREYRERRYT